MSAKNLLSELKYSRLEKKYCVGRTNWYTYTKKRFARAVRHEMKQQLKFAN